MVTLVSQMAHELLCAATTVRRRKKEINKDVWYGQTWPNSVELEVKYIRSIFIQVKKESNS